MKKITNRIEYFKEKKSYVNIHLALLFVRLIGIALYVILLVFVIIYSIYPSIMDNLSFTYKQLCDVTKIVYPIYTLIWIGLKVIFVLLRKRLAYYKKQLEIIDEV